MARQVTRRVTYVGKSRTSRARVPELATWRMQGDDQEADGVRDSRRCSFWRRAATTTTRRRRRRQRSDHDGGRRRPTTAAATTTTDEPTTTTAAAESTTTATDAEATRPCRRPRRPRPTPPIDEQRSLDGDRRRMEGTPAGCDPLDTRHCLLPFPSNASHRATGASTSRSRACRRTSAACRWTRPSGTATTGSARTRRCSRTSRDSTPRRRTCRRGRTSRRRSTHDASVVLVEIGDGGDRVPLWAELDAQGRRRRRPPARDPSRGRAAPRAARTSSVCATWSTRTAQPIEPSAAFRAYRDGVDDRRSTSSSVRRAEMEDGVRRPRGGRRRARRPAARVDVHRSRRTENIAGRMLHIRDDALADARRRRTGVHRHVGDAGPRRRDIALQIDGTFTVPNYLTVRRLAPATASSTARASSRPATRCRSRTATLQAPFLCNVSAATMSGTEPAHLVQYGHGLLGSEREINAGNVRAFAQRAQRRVLRDEVGGHERGRHRQRRRHARRDGPVPDDGRPSAAGRAQPDLPRPADDPRGRSRRRCPRCSRAGRVADDRHRAPRLRRQQPGRDHGLHARRGVARHRARRRSASPARTTACCCRGRSTSRRTRRSSSRRTRTTSTG